MEQIRITKVIRTGTSLCIVIPKEILQALHIERGDQVIVRPYSDGTFIVSKITNQELLKLNKIIN